MTSLLKYRIKKALFGSTTWLMEAVGSLTLIGLGAALAASLLFLFELEGVSVSVFGMMLSLVMGAIGSYIHVAFSFATRLGEGTLAPRWFPWYFIRIMVGSLLAVVVYFTAAGGLLNVGLTSMDMSSIGGLAALVGLFSKPAVMKLKEVFETVFSTKEPPK